MTHDTLREISRKPTETKIKKPSAQYYYDIIINIIIMIAIEQCVEHDFQHLSLVSAPWFIWKARRNPSPFPPALTPDPYECEQIFYSPSN